MSSHSDPVTGCRIIAVANQKGGVGKTTTAVNLAVSLAMTGQRVLLVDLDPQCNASTGLGLNPAESGTSAYEVILEEAPLADAVVESRLAGLSVVPSSPDLSSADVELASHESPALKLKEAISGATDLKRDLDWILVDCPPSLNLLTVNALAAGHSVLVPLQCEYYALEGLSQLILTIRRVREQLNPGLRIEGVILTMVDRRNRLSQQVESDARENLGSLVYDTVIPRNVRLSEAPSFGLSIAEYDPRSSGHAAYRNFATEFLSTP